MRLRLGGGLQGLVLLSDVPDAEVRPEAVHADTKVSTYRNGDRSREMDPRNAKTIQGGETTLTYNAKIHHVTPEIT